MLTRWDGHDLDFYGHVNQFDNLVSRASLTFSATSLLCGVDDDVRFTLDVRDDGTAVFQSVRCSVRSRRTHCLVRDGRGPTLTRITRALNLLRFRELSADYTYQYGFTTHGTDLTTTVWFANGERKSVATYDRQGPLEAWSAQQMFLGLLSQITWVKERRLKQCDGIHNHEGRIQRVMTAARHL